MLSCGVFIYLKKAFDTSIDHCILLQKLYHYGITGIINDRFHSYFTDCVQSTQTGSEVSTKLTTACGVPQESVLGPLLGSLSKTTSTIARTLSENVTSRFCNHFSIIQSNYACKISCNYPGNTLEPALQN